MNRDFFIGLPSSLKSRLTGRQHAVRVLITRGDGGMRTSPSVSVSVLASAAPRICLPARLTEWAPFEKAIMFKILASEPVGEKTVTVAWWAAWSLLLVALMVFNLIS